MHFVCGLGGKPDLDDSIMENQKRLIIRTATDEVHMLLATSAYQRGSHDVVRKSSSKEGRYGGGGRHNQAAASNPVTGA